MSEKVVAPYGNLSVFFFKRKYACIFKIKIKFENSDFMVRLLKTKLFCNCYKKHSSCFVNFVIKLLLPNNPVNPNSNKLEL